MTVFVLGTVLGTPLPGACRNLPTGDSLGPANASLRPRGCPEPGRAVPGGRGVKSCRRSPSCSDPALNAAPIIGPLSGPALPLCPGTAAPARAFSPRGRDGETEVVVALPLCPERCLLASPRSARESNGSVSASVLLPLPGRIQSSSAAGPRCSARSTEPAPQQPGGRQPAPPLGATPLSRGRRESFSCPAPGWERTGRARSRTGHRAAAQSRVPGAAAPKGGTKGPVAPHLLGAPERGSPMSGNTASRGGAARFVSRGAGADPTTVTVRTPAAARAVRRERVDLPSVSPRVLSPRAVLRTPRRMGHGAERPQQNRVCHWHRQTRQPGEWGRTWPWAGCSPSREREPGAEPRALGKPQGKAGLRRGDALRPRLGWSQILSVSGSAGFDTRAHPGALTGGPRKGLSPPLSLQCS